MRICSRASQTKNSTTEHDAELSLKCKIAEELQGDEDDFKKFAKRWRKIAEYDEGLDTYLSESERVWK